MALPWAPPRYGGECVSEVLVSAVAALRGAPAPLPIPPAERIVVVLVDGLGWHQLRDHSDLAPFLSGMDPLVPTAIDAAFPSTTVASLASFGTGLSAGRHGLVGASFWLPDTGRVLSPLGWRDEPHPRAIQPEPCVFESATGITCTTLAPREYHSSGLTRAVLRGARYPGADSPGEIVAGAARAIKESRGPALIYAYLSDLDKSGHVHGAGSQEWRLDLHYADATVADLAGRLPSGTVLLVTADHGMVNVPDDRRVSVDRPVLWDGVRVIAGEPRMRHVYTAEGVDPREVADRWQSELGEAAVVVPGADVIEAGYFGEVDPGIDERIGDVLAIPVADFALVSTQIDSIVSSLRGQHGGLTPEERAVPLLGLRVP